MSEGLGSNPYQAAENEYDPLFTQTYLAPENYEEPSLALGDDALDDLLIRSLDANIEYWNKDPWKLQETDTENVSFFLGDQLDSREYLRNQAKYVDNRLFTATRAILSYATGRLAVPELTPSRSDEQYVKMARSIQAALYQHALDEHVDQKTRAATTNLLIRKRGYLKLRYDPEKGAYGDVITEVCNPEDIIIDRFAGYMKNPNIIYHRLRCSISELIVRFPSKEAAIRTAYAANDSTTLNQYVTYFEAWFTYRDNKGVSREGLCWFIPDHHLILEKMPNPNWVYTGSEKKDKETNVVDRPPKPFVWFNYLNMGHSFIDETSLFDQAKPQQEMLNRRGRQFNENVDFMNGRWIASKKAFSEEDAQKFVNRGARTIGLVNAEDVGKAVQVLTPTSTSPQVYESMQDFRNEIDGIMGTPSVFKGEKPSSQDTLGRDMMVKQQAGMLQDDLVRAISIGMTQYYSILLQLMRVYYTDDYWFQVKGGDGKFDFIMLNGDMIDSNVKIGVEVDSTLPLDKANIRATALELAKLNRIDQLTLLEDLGLPNPGIRTERFMRSQIDPMTYMQSMEQGLDNNDAEVDIMLLTAGKTPEERDVYDEGYLNYFNDFLTKNKFTLLPEEAQQRLIVFLQMITQKVAQTAQLQGSMLDDAGILDRPPMPPLPKRTEQIRIDGKIDPSQSAQIAGGPQPPPPAPQAPPAPM